MVKKCSCTLNRLEEQPKFRLALTFTYEYHPINGSTLSIWLKIQAKLKEHHQGIIKRVRQTFNHTKTFSYKIFTMSQEE